MNAWIEWVRQWAKDHDQKYSEALRDAKMKEAYAKQKPVKPAKPARVKKAKKEAVPTEAEVPAEVMEEPKVKKQRAKKVVAEK